MSISALATSAISALLPGAIDAIGKTANAAVGKTPSAAEVAAIKAADAKAKNKTTLDAIRDKGIYQWAKEQQLEKLKEKDPKTVKEAERFFFLQ